MLFDIHPVESSRDEREREEERMGETGKRGREGCGRAGDEWVWVQNWREGPLLPVRHLLLWDCRFAESMVLSLTHITQSHIPFSFGYSFPITFLFFLLHLLWMKCILPMSILYLFLSALHAFLFLLLFFTFLIYFLSFSYFLFSLSPTPSSFLLPPSSFSQVSHSLGEYFLPAFSDGFSWRHRDPTSVGCREPFWHLPHRKSGVLHTNRCAF